MKRNFVDFGPSLTQDDELGVVARDELPSSIEKLKDGSEGLTHLFQDIDPISGRKRGQSAAFKLDDVIKRVERLTNTIRTDAQVFIEYDINSDLICYGYESDLQAALMNLVINATFWLDTEKQNNKLITIESKKENEKLLISIKNNGPAINEMHHERIFDAGFTLKTNGHGLGLVIAREALMNSDGDLLFDKDSDLTSFIIEFPFEAKQKK